MPSGRWPCRRWPPSAAASTSVATANNHHCSACCALLGLDAKLSQYTRGKAFVDHVVGQVGMARFNTIWTGPETLPLPIEIEEPQRWIDRVL